MNIHQLRDYSPDRQRQGSMQDNYSQPDNELMPNNRRRQPSQQTTQQQFEYAKSHRVLLISGRPPFKNPRKETYLEMLMYNFCPTFTIISITTLLVAAYILIFTFEVATGLNRKGEFLQISWDRLVEMGGNYGPRVAQGDLYRLVTANFLHLSFVQIASSIFSTIVFASTVEYTFGPLRTLVICILCGVGGNLISLITRDQLEYRLWVTAGGALHIFGMIGLTLGYFILNWRGLDNVGPKLKFTIIKHAAFMMVFIFGFSLRIKDGQVDYSAQIGAIITGVWTSAILKPLRYGQREKKIRLAFVVILVLQLLVSYGIFYSKHPQ